jgi:hypothetical protein
MTHRGKEMNGGAVITTSPDQERRRERKKEIKNERKNEKLHV